MKRHLMTKVLALFVSVAVLSYSVDAQAGSASVGDATHANFTSTTHDIENVIQNVPNNPAADDYLEAIWEAGTNYGIAVTWMNSAVSFNPAVMNDPAAFDVIWKMDNTGSTDIGEPDPVVSNGFLNYFPILEQGGVLYRKVGNFNADSNGLGVHTHIMGGASSWGELIDPMPDPSLFADGSENVDSGSNPDFSSGGSAITFGLYQWGGSGAGQISPAANATTVLADFDVDILWTENLDDLINTCVAHYEADLGGLEGEDPLTQGWTRTGSDGNTIGVDDGGVLAWQVTDDSNSGGGNNRFYRHFVSSGEHLSAAANGWKLSGTIRLEEPVVDTITQHIMYGDGSNRSLIWLDLDGDGNLVVIPNNGGTLAAGQDGRITTDGTGDDAYHDYEIIFDPIGGTRRVVVDGITIFDDIVAAGNSFNGIEFGTGSSGGQGVGYYNDVKFEILEVPEPSSLLLIGFGLLGLAGFRRR